MVHVGHNVFRVNSKEELIDRYKKMISTNFSISASPYYDIDTEYRAIVVGDEVELIYGKVRPIVFGNGVDSIKELLIKFNSKYFSKKEILEDEKYNKVLAIGEKYEYSWKFNLEGGANINLDIDEKLQQKISNMAKKVASKLNINFGSIDIVMTSDGELKVLEINSGVMMKNFIELHKEGDKIAYQIYKKAIINMFGMKNSNWKEYYNKTITESASKILQKYFNLKLDENKENKIAIDLGCGAGNDTIYLLENNYKVTAVDKEKTVIDVIKSRIKDTSKLDFIIKEFEKIKLHKADLIVANFSTFFCKPEYFDKFCNEITNNIIEGGYFVGNFLGKEDEWSKDTARTFIDKDQLNKIFKEFEIVFFEEQKFNKKTAKGNMKFWHVYQIIAKRHNNSL